MTRIDEEEVRRVAGLARLELDDAEVRRLAGELGSILEHVEELRAAPPAGAAAEAAGAGEEAPADAGTGSGSALRPDVPSADPLAFAPHRAAPDGRDGFFVVPRLPAMEGPEGDDR